jgi:hypothetical protein
MIMANPIRLPVSPDLLRLVHNNQLHPLNKKKLSLRLSCIREELKSPGLSQASISYITASWRQSTNKKYDFIWRKWKVWCDQRKIDSLRPTCHQIINYLSNLAENKFSYHTINAHKAAIIQTISACGNFSYLQSPIIVRFMKGVFLSHRPKPEYTSTWDVGFLKTLYPLDKLNLKDLTLKMSALIALTTAQRVQTLISLNIKHMSDHGEYVVFTISDLQKTSRPPRRNVLVLF